MTAPPRPPDERAAPLVPPSRQPAAPPPARARGGRPAGPSVAGRAALALALLVGWFALAAAVVGGLGLLTVQAAATGSGVLTGKFALVTGLVALAVVRAVVAVERRGAEEDDGIAVPRTEQPQLWQLVDDVAAELGVPGPDELRLVEDVNAFVRQDTRLLGLVGGRRTMALGAGLLQALTVDQLRAVVAHELGHLAGGDTRLSALVHRAGATIERTVASLGGESLLGRLFGCYARLYQRVSLAVRRMQELRADEAAVRVAGRAAHGTALRQVQACGRAWGVFGEDYVVPLWRAGTAPRDLYAGYRALLSDPLRREQLDDARLADGAPGDPYDSHPPLAARLEHLHRVPDRPAPGDRRPARSLLRDPASVERRVTGEVNARGLGRLPEDLYDFGEQLDAAPYTAALLPPVAALSDATARVDGRPGPAGLGRTLALLEAGRDDELVAALTGDRRDLGKQARQADLAAVVTGPLTCAAEWALVGRGEASWRASWAGPLRLVDADGADAGLAGLLGDVLRSQGVPGLRPCLRTLEVPLDDAALPLAPDSEPGRLDDDEVVAVWPELRNRWRWFDAIVTRDLLVVVPQRRAWLRSVRRGLADSYGVGLEGLRRGSAERVQALLDVPLEQVCARPGVRVLRWDQLPLVRLKRGVAAAWVLGLPGQDGPVRTLRAEDHALVASPDQTAALLRRLVGARLDTRVRGA